jgi:hypothetical protein
VLLDLALERLPWRECLALPPLDRLPDLLGGLGIVGAGLVVAMSTRLAPLVTTGAL